jgi:hypothetical protein
MEKKGKSFLGGLNSLLGGEIKEEKKEKPASQKQIRGRPKTQTKEITKSSQEGTLEGETRATFIVKEELLQKLKAVAFWERAQIKEIINQALEDFLHAKGDKYVKSALKEYEDKQK